MKKLIPALVLHALCSSLAAATIPDPQLCSISPIYGLVGIPGREVVIVSPWDGYQYLTGTQYTVRVATSSGAPIAGSVIRVEFHPSIIPCPDAQHSAVTDWNGEARIWFTASGCLTDVAGACVITADGIEIRQIRGVRSPDNGDHYVAQPDGAADVIDLTYFGSEYKGSETGRGICHDYDYSLACDTVDLTYFGEAFKRAFCCRRGPRLPPGSPPCHMVP